MPKAKRHSKGIESRPIVIPKTIIDLLLKEDEPLGLIALYNFYYYTAVWQQTSQPYATVSYVARGLKIGIDRVRRLRRVLLKLGMIEDIQDRNAKGDFLPRYVRVNYLPVLLESRSTQNQGVKCLIANNKARHSLLETKQKKSFDKICATKLENLVRARRKLFRKVNKKNWILHFKNLRTKSEVKQQRIKKVLLWYIKHFGEKYVPVAYSAKTFCTKFINIEDAMNRGIEEAKKGKKIIYTKVKRRSKK